MRYVEQKDLRIPETRQENMFGSKTNEIKLECTNNKSNGIS